LPTGVTGPVAAGAESPAAGGVSLAGVAGAAGTWGAWPAAAAAPAITANANQNGAAVKTYAAGPEFAAGTDVASFSAKS
jgi:hypothetical protein